VASEQPEWRELWQETNHHDEALTATAAVHAHLE
jgi:hypothetical protein